MMSPLGHLLSPLGHLPSLIGHLPSPRRHLPTHDHQLHRLILRINSTISTFVERTDIDVIRSLPQVMASKKSLRRFGA